MEAAFIDGASHFTIFRVLILPLSVPALASFAIFQFLWVWNDYLVALIFLGAQPNVQVLTMRLADMVGLAATPGTCSPRARSSRCSCRFSCSSGCSATSSAACWPVP